MTVQSAYGHIQNIRHRQDKGERIKCEDIDFMAKYGRIEYLWEEAKERGIDPISICSSAIKIIDSGKTTPVWDNNIRDMESYLRNIAARHNQLQKTYEA